LKLFARYFWQEHYQAGDGLIDKHSTSDGKAKRNPAQLRYRTTKR